MNMNGINYEVINEGNSKKTKTFLFIHGSGCNTKLFYPIVKNLGYQSIIIDLPGHGKSEGLPCKSIYEYGAKVNQFIRSISNKFKELVVVGHSMGGCIALLTALENNPSVKGIVILNSGAYVQMEEQFIKKLKNGNLDKLFLIKGCGNLTNINVYKILSKSEKEEIMINDLLTSIGFNVEKQVANINIPTLVVAGDKDKIINKEAPVFLKKHIKNCRLEVLKNTGHLLPVVRSKETANILESFADSL